MLAQRFRRVQCGPVMYSIGWTIGREGIFISEGKLGVCGEGSNH